MNIYNDTTISQNPKPRYSETKLENQVGKPIWKKTSWNTKSQHRTSTMTPDVKYLSSKFWFNIFQIPPWNLWNPWNLRGDFNCVKSFTGYQRFQRFTKIILFSIHFITFNHYKYCFYKYWISRFCIFDLSDIDELLF